MTADQHHDMMKVLREIRDALEKKPAPTYAAKSEKKDDRDAPVPQPTELVDLPGSVEVGFGKNKGQRLDDLAPNSLRWYAVGWEPREKTGGGLWPNDAKLRNAARQLWHAKHGSGKTAPIPDAKPATTTQATNDDPLPF